MFNIWTSVTLGVLSLALFIWSIIKHEERLQKIEGSVAEIRKKNLSN